MTSPLSTSALAAAILEHQKRTSVVDHVGYTPPEFITLAVELARRIQAQPQEVASMVAWLRDRARSEAMRCGVAPEVAEEWKAATLLESLGPYQAEIEGARRKVDEARAAELLRCVGIVQAARFGEVDQDFRAVISMIESGLSVDVIKARDNE